MSNFEIIAAADGQFTVTPISPIARSLVHHCRQHGDNLTYPTARAANEAAQRMETAIENRRGRAWVIIK